MEGFCFIKDVSILLMLSACMSFSIYFLSVFICACRASVEVICDFNVVILKTQVVAPRAIFLNLFFFLRCQDKCVLSFHWTFYLAYMLFYLSLDMSPGQYASGSIQGISWFKKTLRGHQSFSKSLPYIRALISWPWYLNVFKVSVFFYICPSNTLLCRFYW